MEGERDGPFLVSSDVGVGGLEAQKVLVGAAVGLKMRDEAVCARCATRAVFSTASTASLWIKVL